MRGLGEGKTMMAKIYPSLWPLDDAAELIGYGVIWCAVVFVWVLVSVNFETFWQSRKKLK